MKLNCSNCNKEFEREDRVVRHYKSKGVTNFFCSRSCSTSHNNKQNPRRKKTKVWMCKYCGIEVADRRISCDACSPRVVDWETVTLGQMREARSYQAHSHVRERARRIYRKSEKPKKCCNCGYDKHYEVAHLKAIEDHDLDTSISIINDITNLLALCPNCHWEYDNGLLDLGDHIMRL